MQFLTIRTFGDTDVRLDGRIVKWRSDSARALFFYLLSHPEGRTRDQIIETLWHTDPDFAVSGRFRVVVYRLRAALQRRGAVLEDRSHYRLEPEILAASDVQRFTELLAQAEHSVDPNSKRCLYQSALELDQGDYLPDETADWVSEIRAQYRTASAHALLELSRLHHERGDCAASMNALERALALDPLTGEDHHQQLMLCLSTVRGKYAAVEYYRRYVNFLRTDLGDTPMLETTALAGRIKDNIAPCICPTVQRLLNGESLHLNEPGCYNALCFETHVGTERSLSIASTAPLTTITAPLVTRA